MEDFNETSNQSTLPISQWASEDRPREKMLNLGKKSLTNSELIAILLRTGIHGCSAIDLAKKLLLRNNGKITDLARLEVNDLTKEYKGLGMAKAVTVLAALELGNRMLKEEKEGKEEVIKSSEDMYRFIAPKIIDLPNEEFWAIYLNQRNKVTYYQRIASGGLTQTTVDLRIIFKTALENKAVALAVAHNHPSGKLFPSNPDKELTQKIASAGEILSIKLIDHIIVGINDLGKPDYYSFTENGLL